MALTKADKAIKIYEAKIQGLELEGSLAMELGLELEEPIAKIHARRTGLHLARAATMRHPVHTIALARYPQIERLNTMSLPWYRSVVISTVKLRLALDSRGGQVVVTSCNPNPALPLQPHDHGGI